MGNQVCRCSLATQTASGNLRSSPAPKVILPTGEVQKFFKPTKAAEVMLETPGHFLVNSRSMRAGQRFSALSADEDLEMGNVYGMFPMNRLDSLVTTSDVGGLIMKALSTSSKKALSSSHSCSGVGRSVRVTPACNETSSEVPRLCLDGIEGLSRPEFRRLISMSRSKKPLLETIAE